MGTRVWVYIPFKNVFWNSEINSNQPRSRNPTKNIPLDRNRTLLYQEQVYRDQIHKGILSVFPDRKWDTVSIPVGRHKFTLSGILDQVSLLLISLFKKIKLKK